MTADPQVTRGAGDARPANTPRWPAAVAGVLAAAITLGVAELAAGVMAPAAAPLVAVGGAFIDATPPWLKDFAIATFGTNDKRVLLIGMGIVIAALAALAGVLAHRRWRLGAGLVLVLAAVGATAAMTRSGVGALATSSASVPRTSSPWSLPPVRQPLRSPLFFV